MQQGYFDQCNDIISNLEDKLSKIQLIVDDLSAFAFGKNPKVPVNDSGVKSIIGNIVPLNKLQNRMIDAGEHADLIIDELTHLSLFLLGKQEDDWKDDLAFTDSAEAQDSSVKQAKPETLEVVEAARKIFDGRNVIMVGNHAVQTPMKRKPSLGATFYCPTPDINEMVIEDIWIASIRNNMMFDAGWLHETKEAAIAHAKALIAVSKGE